MYHIICKGSRKKRILPRLARDLAKVTGWTIGEQPDPNAQINYWFPYLEILNHRGHWPNTLHAAWFTHHDTMQAGKADLWRQAAERVDLRLVSARIYLEDLEAHGPSAVVTVPLDRQKFKPDTTYTPADMPVVGVSGWVYPGGRKGEGLVKKLQENKFGQMIHLVACGHGWPLACQEIPWKTLETFYQNLDIYLCTSLIEGVCYGPLEALACGKKVVIPRHVGILDDLPSLPGIHRYKAGDFVSMSEALKEAIDTEADPETLRTATDPFSLAAWGETHERAFEDYLYPPRNQEIIVPWGKNGCSGSYYVAYGQPSREMAKKAIKSFKREMGSLPVAFVSDSPLGAGEDHFITQPDHDIGGRIAKINIDRLAPPDWQYILYLDADTEVVADISFFFEVLSDGWEMVICKNPGKYHEINQMARPDNGPETALTFEALGTDQALQLNGGVFAYRRNENTKRFFELWLEEWNRFGARDQAALHRALWRQPLRTYVLGNEWNTIIRYAAGGGYAYDSPEITAGVLHYPTTARRWSGRIEGRLDGEAAWAAVSR
jgi:hypothetical protein